MKSGMSIYSSYAGGDVLNHDPAKDERARIVGWLRRLHDGAGKCVYTLEELAELVERGEHDNA